MERVVGVEQLLLQRILVLDELDVVDEQDIALSIVSLQCQLSLEANRLHEVVEEGLRGHIEDSARRTGLHHPVADGVEQVGLAKPRSAIDEQRVVGATRRLSNRLGSGERHPVRLRGDEGLEGESGIKADAVG